MKFIMRSWQEFYAYETGAPVATLTNDRLDEAIGDTIKGIGSAIKGAFGGNKPAQGQQTQAQPAQGQQAQQGKVDPNAPTVKLGV